MNIELQLIKIHMTCVDAKLKVKKNTATIHQKIKFVLGDYMKIVIWWGNKPFGGEGSTGGFFLVGRNN